VCFAAQAKERARAELVEVLHQIDLRCSDIPDARLRQQFLAQSASCRRAKRLADAWGLSSPSLTPGS
jgi:hypothetical protein